MEQHENRGQFAHEEEIDLLELARKLWNERRLILRWCGIAFVIALVIGFSIPKEYATTVKLAPETNEGGSKTGNLGALASMAGINLGSGSGADAVYPELYPDVVASIPFSVGLFDVQVTDQKGKLQTDLYTYLTKEVRAPWWSTVIRLPFRALGWFTGLFRAKQEPAEGGTDTFRLTREEAAVVNALSQRIQVVVDKKTSVITLTVMMQDPLIAATLTDTVLLRLQEYITDYRTNKARHDLKFTQKLFDEAQANYYGAQKRYADYLDANQNIVLRSVRIEQERLQNETDLAYNLYNQMAQQLQIARAKVQESTPVYTVIQPATVSLKAAKPSKPMILVGCLFLACCAAAGWILFGRELTKSLRNE